MEKADAGHVFPVPLFSSLHLQPQQQIELPDFPSVGTDQDELGGDTACQNAMSAVVAPYPSAGLNETLLPSPSAVMSSVAASIDISTGKPTLMNTKSSSAATKLLYTVQPVVVYVGCSPYGYAG
jgi:hypothetical protein